MNMNKIIKILLVKPDKMTGAKLKHIVVTFTSLCVICIVFIASLLTSCEKKGNCIMKIAGFYTTPQSGYFDGNLAIAMPIIMVMKNKTCDKSNTFMSHTISSLSIKTIYDYSADFLAGSDITQLFKSKRYHDIITIDELIQLINNDMDRYLIFYIFLSDFTCKGEDKKLKFEIKILLSDGDELVHQTDDLLLN